MLGSTLSATEVITLIMVVNGLAAIPFGVAARRSFATLGKLSCGLALWSGVAMHGHALLTFAVAAVDRGSLYGPTALSILFGAGVGFGGAWIIILGRKAYGDQRRVYGLLEDRIIETGIYRWSRNPQYLGYSLIFFGVAIASGSALAWLFVGVFLAMMHAGITRIEEPHLARVFGADYARYKQRVGRYVSIPQAVGGEG
jgi:protein-S-isoprenylcysteine O-methyltransferase Ste14